MPSPLKDRMSHILLRLYPRAWRERYGDEFLALLEIRGLSTAAVVDTVRTAARERGRHAFQAVFGTTRDEQARQLRRYARLAIAQVMSGAAAALVKGLCDVWFGQESAPIIHTSTWTPRFVVLFVDAVLEVSIAAYALGSVVQWVRKKYWPRSARQSSMLLTIAIGFVVGILASGPPATPWSVHLSAVNDAFGPNNILWIMLAQLGIPAGLSAIRTSKPPVRTAN